MDRPENHLGWAESSDSLLITGGILVNHGHDMHPNVRLLPFYGLARLEGPCNFRPEDIYYKALFPDWLQSNTLVV